MKLNKLREFKQVEYFWFSLFFSEAETQLLKFNLFSYIKLREDLEHIKKIIIRDKIAKDHKISKYANDEI